MRQLKSRPLADAFEAWLRAKLALISQKITGGGSGAINDKHQNYIQRHRITRW